MANIDIAKAQVIRKTNFSVSDLYFTIYSILVNTLGYSFNEDDYSQWEKESGRDIEFHWTFIKKMGSYVHFKIWFENKIRFIKGVKVKVGDEVKSMENAEAEINIKAVMITDPGGKWAKHSFLKYFQKFYETIIFKKTLENYTERLWENLFYVEDEIKAFFDISNI